MLVCKRLLTFTFKLKTVTLRITPSATEVLDKKWSYYPHAFPRQYSRRTFLIIRFV